ncbi:MAG: J domain-containing protein, partial [Burkholderiales bacterium]
MATTYYELLGVSSTASPGEIRTAFRRQIARYHPDKTQHLGVEFQNMAAGRSAELTLAYKILTDETLRADYDASVRSELARPRHAPTPPSPPDSTTMVVRTGVSDLVRRAAVGRFRHALHAEFGSCEEAPVQGFEVVCAPSRARLWSKLPPRMYVR